MADLQRLAVPTPAVAAGVEAAAEDVPAASPRITTCSPCVSPREQKFDNLSPREDEDLSMV